MIGEYEREREGYEKGANTFQDVLQRDDTEWHDGRVDALQELFYALLGKDRVRWHALLPSTPSPDLGEGETAFLGRSCLVFDDAHLDVDMLPGAAATGALARRRAALALAFAALEARSWLRAAESAFADAPLGAASL